VGQAVGRIKDIPTVAELMERVISEATAVKETLNSIFQYQAHAPGIPNPGSLYINDLYR